MDYKDQVKALRLRVPISIQAAILRLRFHQGDIGAVEQEFIEHCIATICEQTNATRELAFSRFKELKYDLTKAISSIREEEYDRNYIQPPGLTRAKLTFVEEWLVTKSEEGLDAALGYHLDSVIATLSFMPALADLVQVLEVVGKQWQRIMGKYQDLGRTHVKAYTKAVNTLRMSDEYKTCEALLYEKMHIIEKELSRHLRNVK